MTRLRQILTNTSSGDVLPDAAQTADALAAAKAAIQDVGLTDDMNARLRRKKPEKFALVHQILPGLWCGGWAALNNDCEVLRRHKITHVVSVVSADKQRTMPNFIVGKYHAQVDDREDADLGAHFGPIVEFIDTARRSGGACYVHCGAGISRAPSTCTAYIMWKGGLSYEGEF